MAGCRSMKYDIVLIDADDTLLDFKKSEEVSFKIILENQNIHGNYHQLLEGYKKINQALWDDHALGLVSKDVLKVSRFEKFLAAHGLRGDPHQMCEDYMKTLPEQVFLVDGATELVQQLSSKVPVVIVTNGIGPVQHHRLEKSGLKPFIELMVISEECGYSKPDRRIFEYTFNKMNTSHKDANIVMVGDKLETDILGAKNIGIDSCWFNPDKNLNATDHVPTHQVHNLLDVLKLK